MLASCSTSSSAVRAHATRVVSGAYRNVSRRSSSSNGRVAFPALGPKLRHGNSVVSDAADAWHRRRSVSHLAAAATEAAAYGAPPATNPEAYIVLVSVVEG